MKEWPQEEEELLPRKKVGELPRKLNAREASKSDIRHVMKKKKGNRTRCRQAVVADHGGEFLLPFFFSATLF